MQTGPKALCAAAHNDSLEALDLQPFLAAFRLPTFAAFAELGGRGGPVQLSEVLGDHHEALMGAALRDVFEKHRGEHESLPKLAIPLARRQERGFGVFGHQRRRIVLNKLDKEKKEKNKDGEEEKKAMKPSQIDLRLEYHDVIRHPKRTSRAKGFRFCPLIEPTASDVIFAF